MERFQVDPPDEMLVVHEVVPAIVGALHELPGPHELVKPLPHHPGGDIELPRDLVDREEFHAAIIDPES